ncbi:MAG TPA: Holliday junction branch migration protein RuvA [Acidimicrobiales bacterium]|nr:Holliday junction branch migration protein RuvA [Acidimicrobiales bacterium]
MIGSLRGVVLDRAARADRSGELLLEVGGVGYRVVVPAGTLARCGELGGPAFVHIHTHVREDAIVLYGFGTKDERVCFEALIGAHGVGPAVALALLSVHSPVALRRAVATDDLQALTLVPGIGTKTAARLLIELKTRLDLALDEADLAVVGAGRGAAGPGSPRGEVRAALAGLGYGHDEVRDALAGLPEDGTVEDLLRTALRQLAGAR